MADSPVPIIRREPEAADLTDHSIAEVGELWEIHAETETFRVLYVPRTDPLPDEASAHADTIFLGPGEDTFPEFLSDLKAGKPKPRYDAPLGRTLDHLPPMRRDLIKRDLYLVPNSIVVSRGCPHHCDFCYKDAFFGKGTGFYVQKVDAALEEIDRLPGKHVYFLDDHLFGEPRFAAMLFDGMKGMGRVLHLDWDLYDTRHTVFRPARMTPEQLEHGYWHAYRRFYQWNNIFKGAMTKEAAGSLRHIAYAGGWKKFEWVWHALIRMKQVTLGLPLLERELDLTRPPGSATLQRHGASVTVVT